MRAILSAVVAVTLLGGVLSSQTHPCDQAVPTSTTVPSNAPLKVQFCAKPSDQPEAFTVYVNGVASDLRPLTLLVGPNTAGLALYEGPKELQFSRGTYTIQLTVWNHQYEGGPAQESPKSAPFTLAVVDEFAPPTAPRIFGVVK